MSRLYNILDSMVETKESLATGMTIYRRGKHRRLVFTNYAVPATYPTLANGDRPSSTARGAGLRRTSNLYSAALAAINVNTDGSLNFYYFFTYNASGAGASICGTGDLLIATVEWDVA